MDLVSFVKTFLSCFNLFMWWHQVLNYISTSVVLSIYNHILTCIPIYLVLSHRSLFRCRRISHGSYQTSLFTPQNWSSWSRWLINILLFCFVLVLRVGKWMWYLYLFEIYFISVFTFSIWICEKSSFDSIGTPPVSILCFICSIF